MLSVIPLHSLNNKAGLQKTMPAEVSACLCVNWSADNGDYMNSDSVFEHNGYRLASAKYCFLPSTTQLELKALVYLNKHAGTTVRRWLAKLYIKTGNRG